MLLVFCFEIDLVLGSGVLLQQSQDLLARNLLELTTSLPDAFSIQSGEIVSTATEPKRASPEFPRASNLSPRRKSPSSREIASFPGTLWGEGTLLIIQHNIRWLDFAAEVRLELAIVVFGEEVFFV